MKEIHVTERAAYKRCRRKWKYQTLWELVPANDNIGGPLWDGHAVHAGLAFYYRNRNMDFQGHGTPKGLVFSGALQWIHEHVSDAQLGMMWSEERQKYNEALSLIDAMSTGYEVYAAAHDDFNVLLVETPLSYHVPGTRSRLVGTPDLLVRTSHGENWVVDHKTYAQYASASALEQDDQMTALLWLLKKRGWNPVGAIYNQLRKKIPATPKMLLNGKLSTATNIDTTYDIYLQAIEAAHLNPIDYMEILDFLRMKPDGFYRREEIYRSQGELEHFGEQLTQEVREMNCKYTPLYPHQTRDCSWDCPYRELCVCESAGGDMEPLMELDYEHAPRGRKA